LVGKIRPRKIIMPSELTGNQRRKRLSGPVITYQLSQMVADSFPSSVRKTLEGVKEKMPSTESFTSMDSSEQQSILLELVREGKSDVEIGDMLDMSQWQVRNLRYKLGIKKDRGGNVQLEPLSAGNRTPSSLINLPQVGAGQELADRGLVLRVSGTYTAREVAQRLKALASLVMVDSDSMQYHLSVTMTELAELEHAAEEEDPELNENEDDSAEDSESSARVS
jgi:hypothetical protein